MFVVTRPLVRVVARDAAHKRACEHLLGVLALDSALWAVGRVARQEVLEAAERNMRCGCQHLPRELRALQALRVQRSAPIARVLHSYGPGWRAGAPRRAAIESAAVEDKANNAWPAFDVLFPVLRFGSTPEPLLAAHCARSLGIPGAAPSV